MKQTLLKVFSAFAILALMLAALPMQSVQAVTTIITQWTFESPNTPAGATAATYPNAIAPAVGTGNAGGVHASASTVWSTPVGNGSAYSFSSNNWSVGNYYQFRTSTAGFTGISVLWDQTGSGTGPRDFKLSYSTDEVNFTNFYSYSLPSPTVSWSSGSTNLATKFSQDLSSITALDNQANVYFRLIDTSTVSITGSTVGTGGTGRVDNFTVRGTGPTPLSGVGAANPSALFSSDSTLLTVAVTPGTFPISTGLNVTCDLSAIGGSAPQAFFDDGTSGDVAAGDNTFSYSTTVAGGTTGGAKNLACTIGDAQSRTAAASIGLTVTAIIPIGTVNGAVLDTDIGTAHTSPYVGQIVTIKGVIYEKTLQAISNSTNTYKGFFIQNTVATADTDLNTSDGLFVFMSTTSTMSGPGGTTYTPTVGDEIVLSGKVSEYYNMTELVSPFSVMAVVRSGVGLDSELPPVVANPRVSLVDANRYWERLQGMRVQVPANSIVLGGRNVFSPADAEVWLASPDSTVALRADPYERRAFRDAHPLDDNYDPINWDGNGYRILMGSLGIKATAGDAQALIAPARTFSTVTNAPVGGVNYSFSKYRIEVTTQPELSEGSDPAANNPPEAFDRSIGYSIVDYNLENLYDYRDNPFSGCDFTGDSGCTKVAPFLAAVTPPYDYVPASDDVYQARLNDIAFQIINDLHSPDILMLQEVENQDICSVVDGTLACGVTNNADGQPDVLQDLALKVASQGGPEYQSAFDPDSSDLRGILPAFMYRSDRVQLLPPAGDPILGGSPAIVYAGASVTYDSDVSNPKTLNAVLPAGVAACETSWVFPRAPDVGLFRIYSTSIGVGSYRDVYVINNHFKSGPDTCVAHRTEQARYNAAIVAFLQAANPYARIVVGGDLNVYPRPDDIGFGASDQLGSLYDPSLGLINLWDVLLGQAPESAYSYVYLGMAQTLDQMFINQPMLADLNQFRIAHINSDFPADYPSDVARGTSDHDPNVAAFVINDPPTVNAGGPYEVDEGSSVTLTATGTDPEGQPLTYAWDLDNNGTFETPGESVTFNGVDGPATLTVNVQVTDNGGLMALASAIINVNNVAPSVDTPVVSPEPSTEGSSVTASATFSDPGVNDAPFTCTVNYGDGSGDLPGIVSDNICTGPAHVYPTFGAYTVTVSVTDKDGGTGSNETTHLVIFNWAGFSKPVDNLPTLNSAKAGSAIPVKFSLGGDKGLIIIADGYPQSVEIACDTGVVMGAPESTAFPGGSSISYEGGQYNYVWKTDKAWAGTCRQLIIMLVDHSMHYANFMFK